MYFKNFKINNKSNRKNGKCYFEIFKCFKNLCYEGECYSLSLKIIYVELYLVLYFILYCRYGFFWGVGVVFFFFK